MCALFHRTEPKMLEEMTWSEVSEKLKRTKTVLIPVGSIESHGLHLPLASDTMQGVEIAKRVAAQLAKRGIEIVPGPSVPFGICPGMMDFSGSIDFKPETILFILKDICRSLYKHGFRNFYLTNAHGGNYAILQVLAQDIVKEYEGAKAVFLNFLPVMIEKYPEILSSQKNEGHSGEGETSRMLVTSPELVEMDQAQVFYPEVAKKKEIPHDRRAYLEGSVERPTAHFKTVSEIASIGNPGLATEQTGEKLYEIICDWMASVIEKDLK